MPTTDRRFREALDKYSGRTDREKIGSALDKVWNAPGYRKYQRETVIDIVEEFYLKGNDVVKLKAPTGSGKSLLNDAVIGVIEEVTGSKAFSTTPLNTLVQQIEDDDLLDDSITLKGKNNYNCIHPEDSGTPVDQAICQTDTNFECAFKDRPHDSGGCPYYGRKKKAKSKSKLVTNISLLMANSMIPEAVDAGFEKREMMIIDECQSIPNFGLLFVGFTVSERSVPIEWEYISDLPDESDSLEETVEWLKEEVGGTVANKAQELQEKKDSGMFTKKEQKNLERLQRFSRRLQNFLVDVEENAWVKNHENNGEDGKEKIKFEPVHVGRFLGNYLWSQSRKVLISSATIPDKFETEIGLSNKRIGEVKVKSTFPTERRPIITTEAIGKMTYYNRDENIPKMANRIGEIADVWEGKKGFVHCGSYSIANRIYQNLPYNIKKKTALQDREQREESLNNWVERSATETGFDEDEGGQVFLSVGMEEGISLDDEKTRFNIIAKASYPNMNDSRVSYRMDENTGEGKEWRWYNTQAVINLEQAYGRSTRSKNDWSATYILDQSAIDLINRSEYLFEDWFLNAVNCDFNEEVVSPSN